MLIWDQKIVPYNQALDIKAMHSVNLIEYSIKIRVESNFLWIFGTD